MGAVAQFHGERLRAARVARGMSQPQVGEACGVSAGCVSQWESDKAQPRPDKISHLAGVLRLPEFYFLRPPREMEFTFPRFRSLKTPLKSRQEAEYRARWFAEVYDSLSGHLRWPAPQVPDLSEGLSFGRLSDDFIEEAAVKTREAWGMGLGPIPNLIRLLESKGVMVAKFAFAIQKVEALSCEAGGRPLVVLNTDSASAVRLRFDAAHELGHLVLHQSVKPDEYREASANKIIEQQAHRFAGAFLFPEESVAAELYSTSPDALIALKKRWGVSLQTLIVRSKQLGLISNERAVSLHKLISRKRWRRSEPLDDVLVHETPTLLGRSLKLLLEKRMTLEALLYELPFTQTDIEIMACLPIGSLSEGWGETIELKPRTSRTPTQIGGGIGKVIQFDSIRQD